MKQCKWKQKTALFLLSQEITLFGSMLVQFALIWHIAGTTMSGAMVSLSAICSFLPQLFISTFAGVWADRYSRKTIILLSDGCIAAVTLFFAVLLHYGIDSLWLFLLILSIRSLGAGIQTPSVGAELAQAASGALLGLHVPRHTGRILKRSSGRQIVSAKLLASDPKRGGIFCRHDRGRAGSQHLGRFQT